MVPSTFFVCAIAAGTLANFRYFIEDGFDSGPFSVSSCCEANDCETSLVSSLCSTPNVTIKSFNNTIGDRTFVVTDGNYVPAQLSDHNPQFQQPNPDASIANYKFIAYAVRFKSRIINASINIQIQNGVRVDQQAYGGDVFSVCDHFNGIVTERSMLRRTHLGNGGIRFDQCTVQTKTENCREKMNIDGPVCSCETSVVPGSERDCELIGFWYPSVEGP